MAVAPQTRSFSPQELEACLRVLQAVASEPSLMDGHERFKTLVAKIQRQAKKEKRHTRRVEAVAADRKLIEETMLVQQQLGPQRLLSSPLERSSAYRRSRQCYMCKEPFTEVHFFYHLLCPGCATLNWAKRNQRANLSGRTAIITGGRIKIGYEMSLKLLRDGARVLVTTRFPGAAVTRFQSECDSSDWLGRLEIHGLDLRDIPGVETFARHVLDREPHLDILIHNAAQTIKRPLAFYQHLLSTEASPTGSGALVSSPSSPVLLEARPGYKGHLPGAEIYFPSGAFDRDGQQVDRRPLNSWRLKLEEVSILELLEVLLVSTAAPFVLTSRLLPALLRSPHAHRFIVNVSAMEGQFTRPTKTAFHPHTNMAKAALNMLTRTTAADLAGQGIHINSVDTGWITDEKPLPEAERARTEHAFHVPLDAVDGASRIYDPIARGLNEAVKPLSGHFLKDYFPYPW